MRVSVPRRAYWGALCYRIQISCTRAWDNRNSGSDWEERWTWAHHQLRGRVPSHQVQVNGCPVSDVLEDVNKCLHMNICLTYTLAWERTLSLDTVVVCMVSVMFSEFDQEWYNSMPQTTSFGNICTQATEWLSASRTRVPRRPTRGYCMYFTTSHYWTTCNLIYAMNIRMKDNKPRCPICHMVYSERYVHADVFPVVALKIYLRIHNNKWS